MTLSQRGSRFSGSYENDSKDICTVTGSFRAADRRLSLQIVCPQWDIRLQGVAAADGRRIDGAYQAYVDLSGRFAMLRQ